MITIENGTLLVSLIGRFGDFHGILVMVTFFTYFNPDGGCALRWPDRVSADPPHGPRHGHRLRMPYRLAPVMVGAFAALLALQNVSLLYRTASFVAANPKVCEW